MGIQTFLDNLKKYAGRFAETSQIPSEFYNFFKSNYEIYISATAEEREKAKEFIKPQRKSFWKSLSRPKKDTSEVSNFQISNLLLTFVKDKALPKLKSTKDTLWLYRGLVAIAMDDFTGSIDHQIYPGNAVLLLADLFITAEMIGITPKPIFIEMSEISSDKANNGISMEDLMNHAEKTKLAWERKNSENLLECSKHQGIL